MAVFSASLPRRFKALRRPSHISHLIDSASFSCSSFEGGLSTGQPRTGCEGRAILLASSGGAVVSKMSLPVRLSGRDPWGEGEAFRIRVRLSFEISM